MNTHARNPSFKLTMVSVWFRGLSRTIFVHLPLVNDKPVMSMLAINAQLNKLGVPVPNGATFSIG